MEHLWKMLETYGTCGENGSVSRDPQRDAPGRLAAESKHAHRAPDIHR